VLLSLLGECGVQTKAVRVETAPGAISPLLRRHLATQFHSRSLTLGHGSSS